MWGSMGLMCQLLHEVLAALPFLLQGHAQLHVWVASADEGQRDAGCIALYNSCCLC
jgi:hypothetical protein